MSGDLLRYIFTVPHGSCRIKPGRIEHEGPHDIEYENHCEGGSPTDDVDPEADCEYRYVGLKFLLWSVLISFGVMVYILWHLHFSDPEKVLVPHAYRQFGP